MEGEGKHDGETNRDSANPYERARLFRENLPPEGVERRYNLPEPGGEFGHDVLERIKEELKSILDDANLQDRAKVTEYLKERYPQDYERMVEEYFKALSK